MKAYNLFTRSPIEKQLPTGMKIAADQLKKINSQADAAKVAYEIVSTTFHGDRIATFLRAKQLFSSGLDELWHRKGFMHCTNQNFLLACLLVHSGRFSETAIELQWTNIWLTPHQYVRIRLNDGTVIDIDCWARWYGIPYGRHAVFFNTKPGKAFVQ